MPESPATRPVVVLWPADRPIPATADLLQIERAASRRSNSTVTFDPVGTDPTHLAFRTTAPAADPDPVLDALSFMINATVA